MERNYILSKKNSNDMSQRQFERNFENKVNINNTSNNINNNKYLERPSFNISDRNNNRMNNFYQYAIPQKASLGYNSLFETQKQPKVTNKGIESNLNRNLNISNLDNSLPNNIYQNFSEHTRTSKKSNTNFNISDRNSEQKVKYNTNTWFYPQSSN